ncbi:MAG TPA: hypothetical protein VEQ63_15300, partial [Bryobacteraceae bacterium]|nr:hypothetical protein [Bryobacteraceae bacterium]
GNTASNTVTGINIDKTAPGVTVQSRTAPNAAWWNNGNVQVVWACSDANPTSPTVTQTLSTEGANQSTQGTCTDLAGNSTSNTVSGINIDTSAPQIALQTAFTTAWRNTDLTLTWGCSDALSTPVASTVSQTASAEGANQSLTGTCSDKAGNIATNTANGINIDKTAPAITLTAPASASSYYVGQLVNAAYGCTDAASGVASAGCIGTVANGSAINTTGVGTTKSFIVNAADMAGNTATISRTYSISAIPSTVSGGLSAGSVQFSDRVTLTALVGAIANTGGVLSGGVTLRIGSQVVATGLPIAAAAAGIPVAMLNPNLPAGTYAVTAEFVSTNPNYAGASNLLGNLTVTREDTPTIRYTGDTLMFTTGNSASVSVRATVEQPQDGSLVDFNALNTGTARLVVDFYRNGTKIGTAPVQNSSVTPGVGVATLAASNWNTATYSVELRLRQTAVFFGGTPALSETGEIVSSDTDAVTVANSTGPNTTGGGWVEDPQSTNRKTNFGVTIKFNKGFTNLQGNAVAVFRSTDPAAVSAANPTGAVSIRIKTNNLIGMGLKPNTTNTVLLTAKANAEVADAVTGAVLSTISGGNITNFTMTVSDTPDQFGFVFRRSDGTVYKLIGSLDASGNVMPVNLGGGQTTVRTN